MYTPKFKKLTREEIDERIELRQAISKMSKSASIKQLRQALEILKNTETQ